MCIRHLTIGAAVLLILSCQSLRAQSDTNEGGGAGNDQQQLLNGLSGRVQALEAWQAKVVEQEAEDIKEELHEEELLETHRRKWLELEKRIQALEGGRGLSGGITPHALGAEANDLPQTAVDRQSHPAKIALPSQDARPAMLANGDQWRYQRFQGRWWYWTPSHRWLYWTGDRWMAPPMPPASAPAAVADK